MFLYDNFMDYAPKTHFREDTFEDDVSVSELQ